MKINTKTISISILFSIIQLISYSFSSSSSSLSPSPLTSSLLSTTTIKNDIETQINDSTNVTTNDILKNNNQKRNEKSLKKIAENIITDGLDLIETTGKLMENSENNLNNDINDNNNNNKNEIGNDKKPKETPLLKLVHDYLLVILLISVMFSMGCGVTVQEVWNHLRHPTSVIVCIFAQFFLVPFIAYLIMTFLELEILHSTGLLILACCPGGVTSNIFTFLADGDLPLSITMTSVATIAALLLMPLNVWLYGRNLETNNLVIPYAEMSITLILVTIPVLFGMLLNYRLPKYSPYITKIGVFAGFGIICFCQSLEVIIFPDIFLNVPYSLYTAVIVLPAFSFIAGFVFAKLFRLNNRISRTIGIEIGIKNVGSALTIISLSFTLQQLKKAWIFPFLYAFSSFFVIFCVTIGYKLIQRITNFQLHKGFEQVNNNIDKQSIEKDENDNRIIMIDDDDDDDNDLNNHKKHHHLFENDDVNQTFINAKQLQILDKKN